MFKLILKVRACKDKHWKRKCEIWSDSKIEFIEKDQEKEQSNESKITTNSNLRIPALKSIRLYKRKS
jgi:hypothetical protein